MVKKIKTISLTVITGLYVLELLFIFSGTWIENIQETRIQNQINKTELSTEIPISLQQWQQITNKREIKVDDTFYDVISFKANSKSVSVTVVEDNLENELRSYLDNLFIKKNNNSNDKKTSFSPFNLITLINGEKPNHWCLYSIFLLKDSPLFLVKKSNKIIIDLLKPPCQFIYCQFKKKDK
jgi:hypothetical protein